MAELLIAVAVISVSLLGTAGALHFGLQANAHGSNYSEASSYARSLLEVMLSENRAFGTTSLPSSSSGYNDASGVKRPLNDPPFQLADYRLSTGPRFQRHIEVINCSQASESSNVRAWKDDLRQITVTIYWNENGRQRQLTAAAFARRPR